MPNRTTRTTLLQVVTSAAVVGAVASAGVAVVDHPTGTTPAPAAPATAPVATAAVVHRLVQAQDAASEAAGDADGRYLHAQEQVTLAAAAQHRAELALSATPAGSGLVAAVGAATESLRARSNAADAAYVAAERASDTAARADRRLRAATAADAPDTVVDASGPTAVSAATRHLSRPQRAVRFARYQIGDPYRFAGAGPRSWDCSGLTMKSYSTTGVRVGGHGATIQYRYARSHHRLHAYRHRRVGDIIFYGSGGDIYHVAIYVGSGRMIEAPYEGKRVREVRVRAYDRSGAVARPA